MITLHQAQRFYRAKADWIGSGEVATQDVAQARANTCLDCPRHCHKPLQELVTHAVGLRVKRQLEVKAFMRLSVEREADLHTCGICECWMPLKVWMPLERARDVTPDWQSFPAHCWLHHA